MTLAALVDLDVASERRAREELAPLCSGGGDHRRIVVTIGERCFVDVRGLAVLIDAARVAHRRQREFVVVAGDGPLRACVEALALQAELPIVSSLAQVGAADSLGNVTHIRPRQPADGRGVRRDIR